MTNRNHQRKILSATWFSIPFCFQCFLHLFALEPRKHNQLFIYNCNDSIGIVVSCEYFTCIISWGSCNPMGSYYYYPYSIDGKTKAQRMWGTCSRSIPKNFSKWISSDVLATCSKIVLNASVLSNKQNWRKQSISPSLISLPLSTVSTEECGNVFEIVSLNFSTCFMTCQHKHTRTHTHPFTHTMHTHIK